jgi:hypothetical protein
MQVEMFEYACHIQASLNSSDFSNRVFGKLLQGVNLQDANSPMPIYLNLFFLKNWLVFHR